jgi:hypothetical protein
MLSEKFGFPQFGTKSWIIRLYISSKKETIKKIELKKPHFNFQKNIYLHIF